MTRKPAVCLGIETALIAAASGEASAAEAARVREHTTLCAPCRQEFERYRSIDGAVDAWRRAAPADTAAQRARENLESRLADLRRRTLTYTVFDSPLGPILIARSEEGVSLIEYLTGGRSFQHSRLGRIEGVEAVEDPIGVQDLQRDLAEYLEGRRTRLDWRLDLRLVRSEFHREVLRATAAIPYGAVTSYTGLAREIGKPSAVRAVAQALRRNPLPIVVPCHRVVGASGQLTGYAGRRTGLKQHLLDVEGIRTLEARGDFRIARERMYVGVPEGQAYCLPTCGWLTPAALGRLTLFASREGAEGAGLAPCSDCRPDLHPIA